MCSFYRYGLSKRAFSNLSYLWSAPATYLAGFQPISSYCQRSDLVGRLAGVVVGSQVLYFYDQNDGHASHRFSADTANNFLLIYGDLGDFIRFGRKSTVSDPRSFRSCDYSIFLYTAMPAPPSQLINQGRPCPSYPSGIDSRNFVLAHLMARGWTKYIITGVRPHISRT